MHHYTHVADTPFADQYELGYAGEVSTIAWYEDAGYLLIEHRARCKSGELDIVMLAPDGAIVCIEVKTRRGTAFGAAEAVTSKKLATMRRCAAEWLGRNVHEGHREVRFDVVEALFDGTGFALQRFEGAEDGAC